MKQLIVDYLPFEIQPDQINESMKEHFANFDVNIEVGIDREEMRNIVLPNLDIEKQEEDTVYSMLESRRKELEDAGYVLRMNYYKNGNFVK